jgi:hypothetical protein
VTCESELRGVVVVASTGQCRDARHAWTNKVINPRPPTCPPPVSSSFVTVRSSPSRTRLPSPLSHRRDRVVSERVRPLPFLVHISSIMSPPGVMFVLSSSIIRRLCFSDQTGRSDIPLTPRGEEQVKAKAPFLVGDGSWSTWIAPRNLLITSFLQNS